jgi:hypothetical protein
MSAPVEVPDARCACGEAPVVPALDLGRHPVASHYQALATAPEERHAFRLGQCPQCALVQFTPSVPPDRLRCPHDWITYREPEAHLDDLVERVMSLAPAPAHVAGVSYKEDSTLARFAARGVADTWRIDTERHLHLRDANPGLEAIQERLDADVVAALRRERPAPDLVVVRHILEHTHSTRAFLRALRAWVRPGGRLVFEVPDAARALDRLDYTTVWEEHTLYFTAATLAGTLRANGYDDVDVVRYPYEHEDSLVAFARASDGDPRPPEGPPTGELERAGRFFASFPQVRVRVRAALAAEARPVAIFGAGHHACAFLNYHDLGHHVRVVVDDDVRKHGLFMPGSRVPIRPSNALLDEEIGLCLMALGSRPAAAIAARNAAFLARGGRFASLFPAGDGRPLFAASEATA